MSEHRRKPPQSQGGGRAGARRAAQQSAGRRAAPPRGAASASPSVSHDAHGEERPYMGRAEARKAAQRSGGRRRMDEGAGHGGRGSGGGRRGGGGNGRDEGPGRGGRPDKRRLIDYPRHGKYGWRRWVPSWKLFTGLCLGFLGMLMGAATIAYAMVAVPNPADAATAQNNVYYWSDGTQMAATGGEVNRQIISIEEIPMEMQNAVISAENKTFRTDQGIDPMGIGRAVFNMARGQQTQGGSTITQQYVKNARLNDQSQTLSRKVEELFISIKVNNEMKKPEIMEGYLNTSYYGRGAYGIQAAARTYYNKDAKDLNASECAVLASLLKGATYYDPAGNAEIDPKADAKSNLERATKRWAWILDEMVKDGHLSAAERAKYTEFPMPAKPRKSAQLGGQIGYLVNLAKAYFINNNDQGITADALGTGGYEIHTTFDKTKVKQLEKAVEDLREKKIDPEKRPKTDTHVQFGGASVDTGTGAIVAIYGGEDATKHFTNNADQTGAQVGSTFKPFVLAAAMRDGVRDPQGPQVQGPDSRRIVDPDKSRYNGKNKLKIKNYDGSVWQNEEGKEWLQVNDGDQSYDNISLREAMIHSANSPFVQLGMDIGIGKVREAAIDAGLLESSLSKANVPSFSLGISEPSAIRMASSYATFAANGEQREPYSVTKVMHKGKTVFEHEDTSKRAFSTAVAGNVTDVLRSVVEDPEGTGRKAAIEGRQVAGKTGTTDGNRSAWFVGYTPQLSTAIDMYRLDDDETNKDRKFEEMYGTGGEQKIHGSSFPSQIWRAYMTEAVKGTPVKDFPEPESIDGEAVWGGGAVSPKPTLPAEPSETPSETPSQTPSETPSGSTSPDPTESCNPWEDWRCRPDDGETGGNGGTDGGDNGGPGNPAGGGGNGGLVNGGGGNGGGSSEPSSSTSSSPGADEGTTDGGFFGGASSGAE
ncbi:transglycosylase domain-containing protein [Streptomyces sp. MUM 178J]|uniref:transglycosylase domain-containing protein n=1 Tax=Streptomyces sp. MUM 178J TaxID=2791991 RepID=UPI001F04308B|nr:transglycosylase domain-containing protein [Streptomyces sp. MUM 178J]WRQ82520.1 transglycosylase domain-containing protein [Streptomyces sp. MUM 178J]